MFRSSNPALGANAFSQVSPYGGETMSIQGTVNKSFALLFLVFSGAWWIWEKIIQPTPILFEEQASANMEAVTPFIFGGLIIGMIMALVTIFKKEWSMFTAPVYAIAEGFVLGGISAIFEMSYPGIVMQAVALTFGTLFCLLMGYKSGLIKLTDKMRAGIVAATGAIFLVYLVSFIMSFFGAGIPLIHGSGPIGIGFSLIVVGVAALNLILDFELIERGAMQGAPRYMEWYGAFALMVTLIWLYINLLRLLSKIYGRRR